MNRAYLVGALLFLICTTVSAASILDQELEADNIYDWPKTAPTTPSAPPCACIVWDLTCSCTGSTWTSRVAEKWHSTSLEDLSSSEVVTIGKTFVITAIGGEEMMERIYSQIYKLRKVIVSLALLLSAILSLWALVKMICKACKMLFMRATRCCRKKPAKRVRFSSNVYDRHGDDLKEHRLVRVFLTPGSHNKTEVIGVYQYIDPKTGIQTCTQYWYQSKQHIVLAVTRHAQQVAQLTCRPTIIDESGSDDLVVTKMRVAPTKWSFKTGAKSAVTIDTMYLPVRQSPYELSRFGNREAPVIDIYGTVHESLNAYICNSLPLHIDKQELARLMDAESEDGDVTTIVKGQKMLVCNDNVCVIRHHEDASAAIDWTTDSIGAIKQKTALLKQILDKAAASSSNGGASATTDFILANLPPNIEKLMSQIDPGDNVVFNMAKKLFAGISWGSRLTSYSWWTSAAIEPAEEEATEFDLEKLSQGTNIKYGDPVDYDEFCKLAKPGDMIAVHGTHAMSRIICKVQSAVKGGERYISHVIKVVDTTVFIMPGMIPGEKYGIESATGGGMVDDSYDTLPDVNNIARSGVQVRSLRGLLAESAKQHAVYIWCPLNATARATWDAHVGINRVNQHLPCRLVSHMENYLNRSYTTTPSNFFLGASTDKGGVLARKIKSMLGEFGLYGQSPIGSEYFCSELTGAIDIDTGVLKPKAYIPHGATLKDLVTEEDLAKHFYVGRQLYPIDYFIRDSKIPYLFDDLHVMIATEAK